MLNQEEGGERSCEDGDEHAETVLHEFGNLVRSIAISSSQLISANEVRLIMQLSAELGVRDPATESQFDYGARAAIWRIMRIFKKHNIPITFYAVARAFERNVEIAKYAEENGHEVASHCYKWRPYSNCTADEEEAYIRKAVESFKKTSPTGKVPVGVSGHLLYLKAKRVSLVMRI